MTFPVDVSVAFEGDIIAPAGTGPLLDITMPFVTVSLGPSSTARSVDDVVVVSDEVAASVENDGTIYTAQITGIDGAIDFSGNGSSVVNNATGRIISIVTSINLTGQDGTVVNHGTIQSTEGFGIFNQATSGFSLFNTGDIAGDAGVVLRGGDVENLGDIGGQVGILAIGRADIDNKAGGVISGVITAIGAGSAGRLKVDNRGEVDGDINSGNADQKDSITNRGDITGDIRLGLGDDRFKGIGDSTSGPIFGNEGDDLLIGGDRNEKLNGNDDRDTLKGGLGKDILKGGADEDIFDFDGIDESLKGSKRDKLTDFERGADVIDVSGIDAKTGVGGNQKFSWIGKKGFNDKKGELRYEDKGSTVIVQGDVDGDSNADFEIFVNVGRLGSNDFVL